MDDSTLHFARPVWLYAGAAGCVLMAWLFVVFDRRREAALTRLVHPRFRHRLMPGFSKALQRTKRVLWLLAVLLLCVAAAGPRMGYEWREVKRRGIDILFAVDTSRSMLAEDLTPNRLERARMGIHDFIERLEGDRVGLIPFAGSSYALCPLTLDYDAFRESLDALDTDLIPRQGTDVASAIREAERLFEEHGNNRRILVLITDGEDLQGDAIEAAEAAAKNGMSIYPVGVGSTEGAVIPIVRPEGGKDFVRDDSGNPVKTKLDEATLKKIAEVTSGLYAQLGRGAEGLDTIYREKLRLVPKSEMDQRMEKVPLERFEWPLAAALVLLLMEFLLPDRRREAKARALPSAARRHPAATVAVPVIAVGILLAISVQPAGAAEVANPRLLYNQGTSEFTAGDFKKAAETLRSSLDTPDLNLQNRAYYNLGNSLYRIGQTTMEESPDETIKTWEEAIKAYGDALALDSTDEDARYNQELVKRKLEELKKKQQEQKKDDQKEDDQNKDQKDQKNDEQKENEKKDQKQDGQKGQEQPDGEKKDAEEKPDDQKGDEKQSEKPSGGKKPDAKDGEQKDKNVQPNEEQLQDGQKDQQKKSDEQKKQEDQQKQNEQKSSDDSKEKQEQMKDGQKGQEQPSEEKKEGIQKPDDQKGDEKLSEKPSGEKQPDAKDGEQKDQKAESTGKKDQKEPKTGEQQKDGQEGREQPNGEKKDGNQKPNDQKGDEKLSEKPSGEKQPDGKEAERKDQNTEPTGRKDQMGQQNEEQQKDGQKGDGKHSEEPTGEKKPDAKDGEQKDQNAEPTGKKDQKGKEGEKTEQPKPGAAGKEKAEGQQADPKKAGGEKPAGAAEAASDETAKEGEPAGISEERRTPGEMTPAEARQLLQALRSDERVVIPLEKPRAQRRFRDPNNTTNGKTW